MTTSHWHELKHVDTGEVSHHYHPAAMTIGAIVRWAGAAWRATLPAASWGWEESKDFSTLEDAKSWAEKRWRPRRTGGLK